MNTHSANIKILSVVACVMVGAALCGCASSGAPAEAAGSGHLYPTRSAAPERVGPGNVKLGSGEIEDFGWFAAAQTGGDRPCFWPSIVGPLIEAENGESGGAEQGNRQCGIDRSINGRVVTAAIHPVHPVSKWNAFAIGIAAYVRPVESVRLTYPGGGSDELHARHLDRSWGVPRLDEMWYVVFAVKDCVRRVEALSKGRVVATTVIRACNPKSIS
jgi:hypothetical protein